LQPSPPILKRRWRQTFVSPTWQTFVSADKIKDQKKNQEIEVIYFLAFNVFKADASSSTTN
jgi:hypothetical protein